MSFVKRVSIWAKTVVCLYWVQIFISGSCEIIVIGTGTKLLFEENFCSFVECIESSCYNSFSVKFGNNLAMFYHSRAKTCQMTYTSMV